jgi:hypothetical protein
MSCIAFSSQIERVLAEAEIGIVFKEIAKELDEVGGSISCVVYSIATIVVGKAYSHRLINAHKMAIEVPSPRVLSSFEVPFLAFDCDGAYLIEATELAGRPWASLQPDDQWNGLVVPGK